MSSGAPVTLKEEVLKDMVDKRWISENSKQVCVSQQKAAESEGCPLSEEITLEKGTYKMYVSVKDRETAFYSRLGRVVVYYDRKKILGTALVQNRRTAVHTNPLQNGT